MCTFRLRLYLILGLLSGPSACGRLEPIQETVFDTSPTPTVSWTPTPTADTNYEPSRTTNQDPTGTPSPSPTTRPETTLEDASRALRNGDWTQAEVRFSKAQTGGAHPEVDTAALLGLARSYISGNRPQRAIETIDRYIERYPAGSRLPDAYFLQAEAFMQQGAWPRAVRTYERYAQLNPGLIDSYLWERTGDAHLANANYPAAAEAFDLALASDRSGNLNFLLLDKAQALGLAGDLSQAVALYDLVSSKTKYDTTRAQMDYLRGQIATQLEEPESASLYFQHATENYPTAYYSYLSLVELVTAGIKVNELQRGLIDFHAAQYLPAIQAFDHYLKTDPEHDARVHYYTALSYRELGDWQTALTHFNEILATHADDPLWHKAWSEIAYTQWAWGGDYSAAIQTYLSFVGSTVDHPEASSFLSEAGRVAERQGDLTLASTLWGQAADRYPDATDASRWAFLSGISLYREEAISEAHDRFSQAYKLAHADQDQASAALMWIGKTQHALGAVQEAVETWEAVADSYPGSYYALRASELKDGLSPFTIEPGDRVTFQAEQEQAKTEEWMASKLGLENADNIGKPSPELLADRRWQRGVTLWRLGMQEYARTELDSLLHDRENDALDYYQIALAYRDLGYYYGSLRSAHNSIDALGLSDLLETPDFLTHLLYGRYYHDLIDLASGLYELNPLLLYSIIRQESLFQGNVVSSAQAQGLMQVIPSTGEWIAAQLTWPNYRNADLHRPYINVNFGAYYLRRQIDTFRDNPYVALAAYNAGPGNANIWYEMASDDDDLFLEVIRLEEPQRYIRSVRKHYSVYQRLYAG